MTDRIQELIETCWDPDSGVVNPRKLAYMVVKECADLTRWQDYDMSREQRIRLEIYEDIMTHFEVVTDGKRICSRCGVDPAQQSCPSGYNSLLAGGCPMMRETAQ